MSVLFTSLKQKLMILLTLSFVVLITSVILQRILLDQYRHKISTLEADIQDLVAASALTTRLREDNARLNRDLNDLRKDLENAAGYDEPLSADIRAVLDRLQP